MKFRSLTPVFVGDIPEVLDEGRLYVSMVHATALHKCCCGCGNEIVTPFSPTDWSLLFDGDTVTLSPSIGNWSFPCQSHYWIVKNVVRPAPRWTRKRIEAGRLLDRKAKDTHYKQGDSGPS